MTRRPFRVTRTVLIGVACLAVAGASADSSRRDGQIVASTVISRPAETTGAPVTGEASPRSVVPEIKVERIVYVSDGLEVVGYMATPAGGTKLPCVIFNRGGNRDFGALDDAGAVRLLGALAARGYVVVASQYRGVVGGQGREEFGGADVNDVLHLIPVLESHPRADPGRIGMYGWSRGGMMTFLALARTDRIRAAVVVGALSDLFGTLQERPGMEPEVFAQLIPDWKDDRDAAMARRSAIRWPEKLNKRTPVLLLHGSADWRVSLDQTLRLASSLHKAKHPFRLVVFEGGDHGLTEFHAERDRLVAEWLDTYVRDGRAWPSLEPHGE